MTQRRPLLRAAALALLLAAGGCMGVMSVPGGTAVPVPVHGAPPAAGPANPAAEAARAGELVNRHRVGVGCPALTWSAAAVRAAQRHSDDMARNNTFTHRGTDGSQVGGRLRAVGAVWQLAAENIAQGGRTADDVTRLWLVSAGHRANIENCEYTHHGVAVSGDRWTHVFFTPATG
jgi:uncharacterized protein YkwD